MSSNEFQHKFNQLFEENMSTKPDPTRNEWFMSQNPSFEIQEQVNTKNMGEVLENIKQKNQGNFD